LPNFHSLAQLIVIAIIYFFLRYLRQNFLKGFNTDKEAAAEEPVQQAETVASAPLQNSLPQLTLSFFFAP